MSASGPSGPLVSFLNQQYFTFIVSGHSFPRFRTVLLMHFFESGLAFWVNHLETKYKGTFSIGS